MDQVAEHEELIDGMKSPIEVEGRSYNIVCHLKGHDLRVGETPGELRCNNILCSYRRRDHLIAILFGVVVVAHAVYAGAADRGDRR